MSQQLISKIVHDIIKMIRKRIELRKYNDFTIENYFRKHGVQIGRNNRIMVREISEAPYLVKIGNHCTITSDVTFITHDGGGWIFTEENPSIQKFGTITILDNCFIGLKAIILPNVVIGPNAIVGAGSVVTRDVPANSVVAGNPAKIISTTNEYKEKVLEIWKKQKPIGYLNELNENINVAPSEIQRLKMRDNKILKAHLKTLFPKIE